MTGNLLFDVYVDATESKVKRGRSRSRGLYYNSTAGVPGAKF